MDANDESYFSREIRIALSESEASIMILLEEAYNKGYDEGWEDFKISQACSRYPYIGNQSGRLQATNVR